MTRTAVNRVLLGLVGLVLLGGGGLLLIGGLNLNRRWHLGLPAHWSVMQPHHAVLTAAQRDQWRNHGWWWPTAFAGLAVLTLLSLWWLIGQLHRGTAGDLPVPVPDRGPRSRTLVRSGALAAAVAGEAEELPGVARARVRVQGHRRRARARVSLTLTPGTAPDPVLRALSDGPLAHIRLATGLTELPAEVRIRADRGPAQRVE
ncbi:alkaline shock response membrane anchor protein AmaP [Streptacidiphilus albus]|uniref:alkaline shock response membrane anchor protein AmaP n=1 Tax=Streptacidiphilus albus TaxID=105425 RepID=UPI00054BF23A|nr:alkaline shock response membrane anchor protein AmaP [Streptacidiphilus albus]